MTQKKYKSDAAAKLHAKQTPKPKPRDSKQFKGGSNPHHDGRGQSGQQHRGRR